MEPKPLQLTVQVQSEMAQGGGLEVGMRVWEQDCHTEAMPGKRMPRLEGM